MSYVLEVGPYWEGEHPLQTSYVTLKEAAAAAWKFCESEDLCIFYEWLVDTSYGKQDCYNVMVPSERDDWEIDEDRVLGVCCQCRLRILLCEDGTCMILTTVCSFEFLKERRHLPLRRHPPLKRQ